MPLRQPPTPQTCPNLPQAAPSKSMQRRAAAVRAEAVAGRVADGAVTADIEAGTSAAGVATVGAGAGMDLGADAGGGGRAAFTSCASPVRRPERAPTNTSR